MLSSLKKIRIDLFIVFLIFLSSVLCFLNYSPGTILSGWDTLHPEFNLQLYLSRILSVWQSHQGLGAPPAQAHAAELPRMIIVWLFTVIFPLSFVRYAYFFLMIVLGPIGVYLLLKYTLTDEKDTRHSSLTTSIASCLGGVFYLFNVGTMQHFIVPLEMFATKFGLLGFLYLFALKFIDKGTKKSLILFVVATIFASPMAHTSTLWYVYFGGFALFSLCYSLFRHSKLFLRRSLILILLSLLLNAYWIIPNIYYGINYGEDLRNSKIHRLFSQEAYNISKKFGNVADLSYMRNFLFDWTVFDNNKVSTRLLSSWTQHLSQPYMRFLALIFPVSSLIGIILAIKKRNLAILALLPVFVVMASFLLSNLGGDLSPLNALVERNTFLKELLRFPFTKFSLYFIFISAVLFALAQQHFLTWFRSRFSTKYTYVVSSIFFYSLVILILLYARPALQGQFISPIVRVKMPQEYFETFKFFNSLDDGRILTLPMHTVFGWNYFDWSRNSEKQLYQGAGFNWFGIKQPTLNREFDRWYPYNEQSYRELSYALYSKNSELLNKLLVKYNIKYLLLDDNAILPDNNFGKDPLFYPETKLLLSSSKNVSLIKSFGKISIYETANTRESVSFIKNAPNVAPIYRWNYLDSAYAELGDYESDPSKKNPPDYSYPARNIFKENERVNNDILQINDDSYQMQLSDTDGLRSMPDITKFESQVYADIYLEKAADNENSILLKYFLPHAQNQTPFVQRLVIPNVSNDLISINNTVVTIPETNVESLFLGEAIINTQKINALNVYSNGSSTDTNLVIPKILPFLCSDPKANQLFGATESLNNLRLYSQNAKVCAEFRLVDSLPTSTFNDTVLELNFNYRLANKNQGSFCLFDAVSNSCIHQQNLSTYIFDTSNSKTLTSIYANQLSNLALRFSFDNSGSYSIENIEALNMRATAHPAIFKSTFAAKFSTDKIGSISSILRGDFPHERYNIPVEKMVSELRDCSLTKSTLIKKRTILIDDEAVLEYKSENGVICDALSLPNANKNAGHILGIESQNISGLPLKFCLQQLSSKKCVLEEELSKNQDLSTDYFIIPPYYQNSDYSLIIKNISLSPDKSVNQLKQIQFIPIPYNYLQTLKTGGKLGGGESEPTVVLDQAYEKGWMAFSCQSQSTSWWIDCQILKDHVLVNNWENGWILPQSSLPAGTEGTLRATSYTIIFWPQYLEYLGFAILLATGLYLWKKQA